MAGYKPKIKIENGKLMELEIAATYDSAGNKIQDHYAKSTNIVVFLDEEGRPSWRYEDIENK